MPLHLLAKTSPWPVFGFVALVLFSIAAYATFLALKENRRRQRLLSHGERVEAMVVYHAQRGAGNELRYFAKLKFETPDGRTFRHQEPSGRSAPWPPLGTKVWLAYDPEDPDFAVVMEWPVPPDGEHT